MTGLVTKQTDDGYYARIIMLDKKTYVAGCVLTESVGIEEAKAHVARDIGKAVEQLVLTGEFPK